MSKKTYKSDQKEWKEAHYGMTHEEWNKWNREYKKVRPLVIERDNNTCQICKGKSDKLYEKKFQVIVHHIKKVKGGGTNELNNLVTLCQFCNITIDNYNPSMERLFGRVPPKIPDSSGIHHKQYWVSGKQMNWISKRYQAVCDKLGIKST